MAICPVKISLDAMGGDSAPESVIGGMVEYLSRDENVFFDIYGDSDRIAGCLEKYKLEKYKIDAELYRIHHTSKIISAAQKPSHALRYGKDSSMFEAVNSVAIGLSDVVVSAGNTGAYMAISKFLLKTVDNIERPALTALVPNRYGGQALMLDLGANIDCSFRNLVEFAIMGRSAAKVIIGLENPRVAILNVGTEVTKGTDHIKKAYEVLSADNTINFIGYIEGINISNNVADVIVTDGFSGNIALKCMEGAIMLTLKLYEQAVKSSLLGKISYIIGKGALKKLKNVIDPGKLNGASLVGLQRIAVKSHGSANASSFASAISVAVKLHKANFIEDIIGSLSSRLPEIEKWTKEA
ncbi:MAG: phosphate acyltransferase PlsX [Holosporales bacterium]|jgi:glycerol-3-phosphate acyltransferase PlsX|nr:phosphate acyltransferase PlsX [Holosporales bacterium]